jgi:hypothetical protein
MKRCGFPVVDMATTGSVSDSVYPFTFLFASNFDFVVSQSFRTPAESHTCFHRNLDRVERDCLVGTILAVLIVFLNRDPRRPDQHPGHMPLRTVEAQRRLLRAVELEGVFDDSVFHGNIVPSDGPVHVRLQFGTANRTVHNLPFALTRFPPLAERGRKVVAEEEFSGGNHLRLRRWRGRWFGSSGSKTQGQCSQERKRAHQVCLWVERGSREQDSQHSTQGTGDGSVD